MQNAGAMRMSLVNALLYSAIRLVASREAAAICAYSRRIERTTREAITSGLAALIRPYIKSVSDNNVRS